MFAVFLGVRAEKQLEPIGFRDPLKGNYTVL